MTYFKWFMATSILFFWSLGAEAQIAETDQRKSWFYLQKLAVDLKEQENCFMYAALAGQAQMNKASEGYRVKVEEFVSEADAYASKYLNTRGKSESAAVFRFRVWRVPIEIAQKEAKQLDKFACEAIGGW